MNFFYNDKKEKVHSDAFPENFRMLIVGQSGSGKTTLLMKLLLEPNLLNYDKLYIFARSLHQPEYQCLIQGFKNNLPKTDIIDILNAGSLIREKESSIEEVAMGMGLCNEEPSNIEAEFYDNPNEIPDPSELDKSIRNLMISDDIMTDKKQTPAENYYTRGRSCNCDSIYLSQNYYHLPRHTIRSNSNFLVLFNLDPKDTDQLYRDSGASVDFKDINKFRQLCEKAWNKKYGYLVIDKSRSDINQRYRFQLELVNVVENVLDQHVNRTPRASKTCISCNVDMQSSSYAKHLKSKKHNK